MRACGKNKAVRTTGSIAHEKGAASRGAFALGSRQPRQVFQYRGPTILGIGILGSFCISRAAMPSDGPEYLAPRTHSSISKTGPRLNDVFSTVLRLSAALGLADEFTACACVETIENIEFFVVGFVSPKLGFH